MLVILFATRKWRQYLLGRKLIVRTDHKPLKCLLEQRLYSEAQHIWLLKLHNYQFEVEYKKSRENVDGLSRSNEADDTQLLMTCAPDWIEQLKGMVGSDAFYKDIQENWEYGTINMNLYQKKGGLFYYKQRIMIDPASPLTKLLLAEHHDTPVGGHLGYEKNP